MPGEDLPVALFLRDTKENLAGLYCNEALFSSDFVAPKLATSRMVALTEEQRVADPRARFAHLTATPPHSPSFAEY